MASPDRCICQLVVIVGRQLLSLAHGHHGHDALDVAEAGVVEVLELAVRSEGVTDLQMSRKIFCRRSAKPIERELAS